MLEYRRCDGYNQKPDSNTTGTGFTNKTSSEVGQFGTGIPRPTQLSPNLMHHGTMSQWKLSKFPNYTLHVPSSPMFCSKWFGNYSSNSWINTNSILHSHLVLYWCQPSRTSLLIFQLMYTFYFLQIYINWDCSCCTSIVFSILWHNSMVSSWGVYVLHHFWPETVIQFGSCNPNIFLTCRGFLKQMKMRKMLMEALKKGIKHNCSLICSNYINHSSQFFFHEFPI